jgi:hypothetical protein
MTSPAVAQFKGSNRLCALLPLQFLAQIDDLPGMVVNMRRTMKKSAEAVANFFHAFG